MYKAKLSNVTFDLPEERDVKEAELDNLSGKGEKGTSSVGPAPDWNRFRVVAGDTDKTGEPVWPSGKALGL